MLKKTKKKTTNKRGKTEKEDLKKGLLFLIIPISAILTALIITNFFINLAFVPSESMEPTIDKNSIIVGSRLAYNQGSPKRGDIVFVKHGESGAVIIKRIIATGGDRFSIKEGTVYINGEPVFEKYILSDGGSIEEITVPEGKVILLGDNRERSNDSRHWSEPCIDEENIIGKALFSLLPVPKGLYD